MGLDMYLEKRHYVKNWSYMKPEELHNVLVLKGGKPTNIKSERVKEVVEEIGYWRKANAIHRWFVENVQDGMDDCKEYYVSREKLAELLKEVELTLKAQHLAPALLPTQQGFFFGSQEYDEYYWQDMEDTKRILEAALGE